jgi:carbon monoxide dehydrogenase subunit G
MLKFEGDRDFSLDPAGLWHKLRDARFLVQCIPDAEAVGEAQQEKAACTVRPGVSFVRGTLEVTVQVTRAVEGQSVNYLLTSKGIGSGSEVEATLAFLPQETGTRVHWVAEIKKLTGLLKAVPSGLIRGAAQKVIEDVWNSLQVNVARERG